jgi:hypothetical protein
MIKFFKSIFLKINRNNIKIFNSLPYDLRKIVFEYQKEYRFEIEQCVYIKSGTTEAKLNRVSIVADFGQLCDISTKIILDKQYLYSNLKPMPNLNFCQPIFILMYSYLGELFQGIREISNDRNVLVSIVEKDTDLKIQHESYSIISTTFDPKSPIGQKCIIWSR